MISMQSHEFLYNLGITALTTGINCFALAHAITLPVACAIPKVHSNACDYIYKYLHLAKFYEQQT